MPSKPFFMVYTGDIPAMLDSIRHHLTRDLPVQITDSAIVEAALKRLDADKTRLKAADWRRYTARHKTFRALPANRARRHDGEKHIYLTEDAQAALAAIGDYRQLTNHRLIVTAAVLYVGEQLRDD